MIFYLIGLVETNLLPAIGGGGGMIAAVLFAASKFLDWLDKRRQTDLAEQTLEQTEKTTMVTDAAAANAVMLDTLRAVYDENERLRLSVHKLEEQNRVKDERIEELQVKVERAAAQVLELYDELNKLKRQPRG